MSDYESDYIYMIPVAYRTKEEFYETITHVPARIRGAFLIDEKAKETLDFLVYSPGGNLIYSNSTSACIFDFNVNEVGRYTIVFKNDRSNSEIRVTYTMNTGQNLILTKKDLTITEQKLENVLSFMKKFNLEFKMNRNVHTERYKSKITFLIL